MLRLIQALVFAHPLTSKNEDLYWGLLVKRYFADFRLPDPVTAAHFSFEVEPRHLYTLTHHTLPFGCHAWKRFDEAFWRNIMHHHGETKALEPIQAVV